MSLQSEGLLTGERSIAFLDMVNKRDECLCNKNRKNGVRLSISEGIFSLDLFQLLPANLKRAMS
jgi:hypothetical protein